MRSHAPKNDHPHTSAFTVHLSVRLGPTIAPEDARVSTRHRSNRSAELYVKDALPPDARPDIACGRGPPGSPCVRRAAYPGTKESPVKARHMHPSTVTGRGKSGAAREGGGTSVLRRNECGGWTRNGRKGRGRAGVAGLPRAPAHGQGGVINTCLPPGLPSSRPCTPRVLLAPRRYIMALPAVSRPALPSLPSAPPTSDCAIHISGTSARPLLSSRTPPSISRCACELRNATGPRPDIHTPPAPASPTPLAPSSHLPSGNAPLESSSKAVPASTRRPWPRDPPTRSPSASPHN